MMINEVPNIDSFLIHSSLRLFSYVSVLILQNNFKVIFKFISCFTWFNKDSLNLTKII